MTKTVSPQDISDQQFIAQFEQLSLDPVYFSHQGHLRLAWLYLNENTVEQAVDKVCNGIKAYANSLGATDKFHLTMTDAFVKIMAKRMRLQESHSWQVFMQQNPDLVNDASAVLGRYFSSERLYSEEARVSLLTPDRQAI